MLTAREGGPDDELVSRKPAVTAAMSLWEQRASELLRASEASDRPPTPNSMNSRSSRSPRRSGSSGGGSSLPTAKDRPASMVEGHLDRWSESRQSFVQRWFALQLGTNGQPPSLTYRREEEGMADGGGGGGTPQSILKGGGATARSGSPERGAIAVSEIRAVKMGFEPSVAMGSTDPAREFQLAVGAAAGSGRTLVLLRAASEAECKDWSSALSIVTSATWRKHHTEAALPTGWKAATDKRGRTFYYEKASGTRTWNHPTTGLPGPHLETPAANEQMVELRITDPGFFGVMFDEEVDPVRFQRIFMDFIRISC